ncbi:hypothetical protein [Jannaschia seohaensis]|uniref:Uncharacterized protein n=1 Tax=Jannaschia seohaensis TaxID=475081 RepID=A0A2Y9BZJ9_9RHOB|nr:hypothetical protein [Jannaschia seohaensis]PWJ20415.1 hypothetical protein BCF38_103232 [Jannaschia seohaensis]SSA44492.1 hypothetical protein SAMN05421539_103232 [Jannaschia seohaensis]
MARTIRKTFHLLKQEPVFDVLGGVWLVTLLLSLLHLPALVA